jgi:hypothetical protein
MRISKDLAATIARALTVKSKQKWDQLVKAYKLKIYDHYMKQTPKAVLKCFGLHPEWFETLDNIRFSGHGFSEEYVGVEKKVIANNYGSRARLQLTAEIANDLKDARTASENAEKHYYALKTEIENALLSLGTTKRIAERFPEAIKYLPVAGSSVSMALIPDLNKLQTKIKNQ